MITAYLHIVMIMGDEGRRLVYDIACHGEDWAVDRLSEFDVPREEYSVDDADVHPDPKWRDDDKVYERLNGDRYVLVWNDRRGYVGLTRKIEFKEEEKAS